MEFFNGMDEHSLIKATLVEKYFNAWSRIMINRSEKIGYIDLFSGTGIYVDGAESTPIKILKKCIASERLRNGTVCIFNDGNKSNAEVLEKNINSIQGIETLKHKPIVNNKIIDSQTAETFETTRMIPCFSFVDPFGYKGVSKRLISSLVKDWGCDCIFFFNYNRINAAVNNIKVKELVNDLFGEECAEKLRINVTGMKPKEREAYIINMLCSEFESEVCKYILPFKFQSEKQNRTSHYLIFVCKNFLGYSIMKDIMCSESSSIINGIGSFSYIPTTNSQLSFVHDYNMTLEDLEVKLLKEIPKNKTISVYKLYEKHSVGLPFILKNYKEVLLKLEDEGKIRVIAHSSRRPKGTMNEKNKVIFL